MAKLGPLKEFVTRFKCVDCGRLTAGRVPVRRTGGGLGPGDLSLRYPRRHYRPGGSVCPGVHKEAEWVEVPWEDRNASHLSDQDHPRRGTTEAP